ncbi:MAG TPA: sugar transferase [Candidatus Dojkabacteria bacterium]|nr:sugar transferase [Candidatus Dojkabacteria bacterium]
MSGTPYKVVKRILDVILSLSLLIIFLPLLLCVSILIFLTDGKNIFVKEPLRHGYDGKEFRMFKFRTMIPNAHKELLENPKYKELKVMWEKNDNKLRIDEDSRITWIGKILRKTDIDELPQLLNVLIGQMSLVGPRPTYKTEVEVHLKKYPEDKKHLKYIFMISPGITGIWQVSGRNDISLHKRLAMEAKYAKNLNFLTDLKILLKTPKIVLSREGAYE